MQKIQTSAFEIAQRFIGTAETQGTVSNPLVLAMLRLDAAWPENDEVSWCSAFVNFVCFILRLPRSKSLLARSWLSVGMPVNLSEATAGFDVCILKRGAEPQPGAENITAPGHVGFFAGADVSRVFLLGGNQGDKVSVAAFPRERVIGTRRLL